MRIAARPPRSNIPWMLRLAVLWTRHCREKAWLFESNFRWFWGNLNAKLMGIQVPSSCIQLLCQDGCVLKGTLVKLMHFIGGKGTFKGKQPYSKKGLYRKISFPFSPLFLGEWQDCPGEWQDCPGEWQDFCWHPQFWDIGVYMGGPPKIRVFTPPNHPFVHRVFHYKSSILGYPYFWKHPYPWFDRETTLNDQEWDPLELNDQEWCQVNSGCRANST